MARSIDSKISRFDSTCMEEWCTVGVDVHKKTYHVAILTDSGLMEDFSMPSDNEGLIQVLDRLPCRVRCLAYEAGPTGFSLARVVHREGISVIVAAPSRIPRPVGASNKTDRLDCRKLAEFASRGLLRSIAIPTVEEETFRALVRRQQQLTEAIRKTKQRIKAFLLFHGIREPNELDRWSKQGIQKLKQLIVSPPADITMNDMLYQLTFLEEERLILRSRIHKYIHNGPLRHPAERLQSVPGVGPILSMTFLAELFRPQRFNRKEEVTAYLGLAPVIRQSGVKAGRPKLRPVGKAKLRSLLVESAWIWKQHAPEAQNVYHRILARNGIPQKAITAVARRLAIKLWKLSLSIQPI